MAACLDLALAPTGWPLWDLKSSSAGVQMLLLAAAASSKLTWIMGF
jgi:hypothetical protein